MITQEDIIKMWWKDKNHNNKYTRKQFYIFVKNDRLFLWRKPEAKDFIQKVTIKVIWVIDRKWWPLYCKCKNENISYRIMKDQNEIYNTSEEIENLPEMKEYLENFIENYKNILIQQNENSKMKISSIEKDIEINSKTIWFIENELK